VRVVHLNTADSGGGAARAALRLSLALRDAGVDSLLVVRNRRTDEPGVLQHDGLLDAFPKLRQRLDTLPSRLYRHRTGAPFDAAVVHDRIPRTVHRLRPSLVNVHWIGKGFMRAESLSRLPGPMVWTLHDAWPFTGGCHVPLECERFAQQCGACPVLGSASPRDLSRSVWSRKACAWADLDLTIVVPSRWMEERARRSSLFARRRIEVIPHAVDTSVFRPGQRADARSRLGVPPDAPVVLFAAMWAENDPNKGFQILAPALARMRLAAGRRPYLLVAGSSSLHRHPDLRGLPARALGELRSDAAMAEAIAAADVVVVPSLQESFSFAALEGAACGRPVVAFPVGVVPELIRHGTTGVIVRSFDADALGEGLRSILDDPRRAEEMGRRARSAVESAFDLATWARRYVTLYEELTQHEPEVRSQRTETRRRS
jgi:glycosyltransferase involved in cell wall biosynthesis